MQDFVFLLFLKNIYILRLIRRAYFLTMRQFFQVYKRPFSVIQPVLWDEWNE